MNLVISMQNHIIKRIQSYIVVCAYIILICAMHTVLYTYMPLNIEKKDFV